MKYEIKFKTPKCSKGEDIVYCNNYTYDDYAVYPLTDDGKKLCTVWRTNIISIIELK